jgi:hypothetical protein
MWRNNFLERLGLAKWMQERAESASCSRNATTREQTQTKSRILPCRYYQFISYGVINISIMNRYFLDRVSMVTNLREESALYLEKSLTEHGHESPTV